jgi:recombination protein RecR
MSNPVDELAKIFSQFPGIGERQSKRFVYFLLRQNQAYIKELVFKIDALQKSISECSLCHRYFVSENNLAECITCTERKDSNVLLIVEKDADYDTVKRSGVYDGKFFVLGGLIPILEKNPERRVRLKELQKRLSDESNKIVEIILALSATREGEYTDEFLRKFIGDTLGKSIEIRSLGRGLSTGTELEYSDSETIISALKNRS